MPTHFQTDSAGLCKLETNAKLDLHLITHATWIKDPTKCTPGQKHTNIKIFCESPEATNALIMSSPQHLGSQLRTHKDIRAPSTCLKCQQYGHFTPNCKETSPTCGKCSNNHSTLECKSAAIKCTPCRSADHQTNNLICPERQKQESTILMKDPEALTPYYSTTKWWTWGLSHQNSMIPEGITTTPREPQHLTCCPKPPPKQMQPTSKHQGTLLGSGSQHLPVQTGANNIPIVNPCQPKAPAEGPADTNAPSLPSPPSSHPVNVPSFQAPLQLPNQPSDQSASSTPDNDALENNQSDCDPLTHCTNL